MGHMEAGAGLPAGRRGTHEGAESGINILYDVTMSCMTFLIALVNDVNSILHFT